MIYITFSQINITNTSKDITTFYRLEKFEAMWNKKIEDQLMKEIFDLTLSFQIEFPEIYDNLLETPLFLNYGDKEISETEFEAYREFLRAQLRVLEKEQTNNQIDGPTNLSKYA